MRILSGIQPSGTLHLGNYFGALAPMVALQDQGEVFFFIADWHALTTLRDGNALRARVADCVLDYLALGVDPEKTCIYRQSDIAEHTALAWMLATVTPMGLLERAHSYKDKLAHGRAAELALFSYPVLMAADILLYNAERVPVGPDQKQHLEMARDIATKFNVAYAPGYNVQDPTGATSGVRGIFVLPEPLTMHEGAQVPGLDGQKMSKSYNNTLELFGEVSVLRKKIMRMPTDSTPIEAPKPEGAALLALLRLLSSTDEALSHEKSWRNGGVGYGTYKKRLHELLCERFAEARARRAELASDAGLVERVLKRGAERARDCARATYAAAAEACGAGATMAR